MFISSRGGIASRVAVLCIAALQGACTTTAEVGTLDDAMHEGYTPLNEEKWAIEQADIFHKEFLEKGLLYNDPDMQSYLNQIEKSLLSNRTDIQERIKLFVLKSPSPNAVAWPNGNIYIHAGLFSPVETDDQLAAVISHEMAHITQKHSVKAIISQKNTLIGAHIGDFATGGLGLVYSGAFANIMDFSRAQESEADKLGLVLLSDSGYQPKAMLEVYKSMTNYPELKHLKSSIYSSHPSHKLRISDLEDLVAAQPTSNGVEEKTSASFVTIKGKMIEDSLQIRLRHREYNLAQVLVDEASAYFGDTSKVSFYLGEVHRGFYRYPEDAAREKYWIDTGKHQLNETYAMKFEAERPANLEAAIRYYRAAIERDPPYPKAFRRLGEIYDNEQRYQQAVDYYNMYLDQSPEASDRTFVKFALDRLEKKINGDIQ